MRQYTVVLIYDPDEAVYVVDVPELPGCFSQGNSVQEALALIKEAIPGHIASLRPAGEDVPVETAAALLPTAGFI